MQEKAKVSITLDIGIIEKIRRMAEEDDRAFSQYINLVLKRHIEEKGTEEKKARKRRRK